MPRIATLLEVTKAEHLEGYRLLVWFNDGALKVIDLTGYLHKPHLASLKEMGRIRRFQIDLGTIIWEGEIDLAPEYLYNIATDTLRPGDRSQWEWVSRTQKKRYNPILKTSHWHKLVAH